MPKTQHTSPYAVAYAQSLLELANESNRAEPIAQELRAIREIVTGSETFRMYLADPGIGEQERGETMKRIFGSQASELVLHFLGVLNAHRRLGGLVEIADAYDDLLDQQLGKIEVDVTVAQKLSPEQLEQVRKSVSSALKKDAVIHQYVDDRIIGGLILRVQDQLIDASVKTQLDTLKKQMLAAAPR